MRKKRLGSLRELMIIEELSKGLSIGEIAAKKIILSESNRNKGKPVAVKFLRTFIKDLTGIDRRLGPRTEQRIREITATNIARWPRITLQFLESKPICSACGDELHHFSHTMLCDTCRPRRNYRRFISRNPLYNAQKWQKSKARQLMLQRKRRLTQNMDEINRRRRIKRREKRRNYEDSLRFKLGKLERDVRAKGLIPQALNNRR